METLNEEIYKLEELILNRKFDYARLQYTLDVAKLEYKNTLDPKDKNYSNDEKRELTAVNFPSIKAQVEDLKKHRYDTELLEIKARYLLRKLNIMIKSELI